MKVKMENLEKKTKTLAQENDRLRSDSAKITKEISDLRSAIDDQAQYTRRECLEIRGVPDIWREYKRNCEENWNVDWCRY